MYEAISHICTIISNYLNQCEMKIYQGLKKHNYNNDNNGRTDA